MGPAGTTEIVRSIRAVRAKHLGALALGVLVLSMSIRAGGRTRIRPCRPRTVRGSGARWPSAQRRDHAGRLPAGLLRLCRRGQLAEETEWHAALGTRRRRCERAGDRRRRRVHPLTAARPVPHARTQPHVVDDRLAARLAGAYQLLRFQARLEYYSGQGIEIQWLGTFGEGNGFYSGARTTTSSSSSPN